MKDMVKKNQVMITALAIMIAVAGYLHFAGEVPEDGSLEASVNVAEEKMVYDTYTLSDISDADLEEAAILDGLDATVDIVLEDYTEEEMIAVEPEENEIPGEAVYTAGIGISTISEAKLMKEQTRAQNKELLLEIIDSKEVAEASKQEAIQNMISMTNISEMEMGAEILLEAKGFEDSIVSVSDTGVDVVVNAVSLSDNDLAQIMDIVKRKTGVNESEIVVSTLNVD